MSIDFAPSSVNSKHPNENTPWGSRVFQDERGQPFEDGLVLRQYLIDSSGAPIHTTDGHLVHILYDDKGEPVTDDRGVVTYVVVDPPEGARPVY